ncbi:MAG TPA: L,D-transpeptidase [Acidimicrobiia bacterium]|nr:L,D-transpeptidase [Acidimicrobiia bacterium]
MLLRISVLSMALVATGCAVDAAKERTAPSPEPSVTSTSSTVLPAPEPEPIETRVIWEGFEASNGHGGTLAAHAPEPLDVYESPEGGEPMLTLDATTILGTPTVLGVVAGPVDGWAEVMLPVRPNGSTGWIRADEVSFYVVDGEIVIDLSDRVLTYLVDGVEMLRTDIGVGSEHNETPTGIYFVTDNVTLADPNSPWGPHALGLSARSDTITEFNGGDGIIGIHGTNNPGSIGGNISLGCVRLPNDMISALHEMVPLGTRVVVNA